MTQRMKLRHDPGFSEYFFNLTHNKFDRLARVTTKVEVIPMMRYRA